MSIGGIIISLFISIDCLEPLCKVNMPVQYYAAYNNYKEETTKWQMRHELKY